MADTNIYEQVELIREVFTYTEKFKGSIFVIKIANEIIDHPCFLQHVSDLALLHKAGIRTVIVPGARRRIDEVLGRFGAVSQFKNGTRISEPATIDLVKMAAFDVAHRVMTALTGHKIPAVIGTWVRARSRGVVDGVDFQRTGIIDRVDTDALNQTLNQGNAAIFPCVGHNEIGQPFNLSSDAMAGAVAAACGAGKIFHLEALPVMRVPEWRVPEGLKALEDGRIFGLTSGAVSCILSLNSDMPGRELLTSAAESCRSGIERVHILDGRCSGVLLQEVFSNLGVGTMIFADDYEYIRPMEASDISGVLNIVAPLVEASILIPRSRQDLEQYREDYWVYAMDGVIHGCAALHPREKGWAEIAAVAVDPRYTQLGIGAKLVSRLCTQALQNGLKRVFVLTTRTADWFLTQGFREASPADLPPDKLAVYNASRNSRVLIKQLS